MRRQQNFIPGQQRNNNPFGNAQKMMQDYSKFRQEYLEQNKNPDPKGAVMGMVQSGQIQNNALQQAMSMAQMFGFKL